MHSPSPRCFAACNMRGASPSPRHSHKSAESESQWCRWRSCSGLWRRSPSDSPPAVDHVQRGVRNILAVVGLVIVHLHHDASQRLTALIAVAAFGVTGGAAADSAPLQLAGLRVDFQRSIILRWIDELSAFQLHRIHADLIHSQRAVYLQRRASSDLLEVAAERVAAQVLDDKRADIGLERTVETELRDANQPGNIR